MECKRCILVGAEEEKVRSSSKMELLRLMEYFLLMGLAKILCLQNEGRGM